MNREAQALGTRRINEKLLKRSGPRLAPLAPSAHKFQTRPETILSSIHDFASLQPSGRYVEITATMNSMGLSSSLSTPKFPALAWQDPANIMTWDEDTIRRLEDFGHVLTPRLVEQTEPLAYAREAELQMLETHFLDATQNSFVLVGPSGCGKTTILRELFRRLGTREENPWLVLQTSSMLLLAGTSYIGEWQTRVHDLLRNSPRDQHIAVYFTDLPNVGSAGRTSKSDQNMANLIGPFVSRGDFTLIGECTPDGFRAGVERLPDLQQTLTVFRVEEPDDAETRQIVERSALVLKQQLQDDDGLDVAFPNRTLLAVQEFGKLYFPGAGVPAGAVKLLQQLVNHVKSQPAENPATKTTPGTPTVREIAHRDVIQTLEAHTGIPGHLLDDAQPLKLASVKQFFESRVIGQPAALEVVQDLITLIKAGLTDPQKPMGVLFFVGPTGVGKTELAKALAEFIFGSADRMLRYDMSEFKDYHSFEKLIGGSSGSDSQLRSQGSLLGKVRQQPFSVILLDEIEKAHSNIFDVLLQLFDDGRLTDSAGQTTNFTQTILIMTSNLGSDLTEAPFGFQPGSDRPPPAPGPPAALEAFFRPEFLNRIDRIVTFRALEREHVRILAQRELGQVLLRSGITRRELRVDVDPAVIDILVREGFSQLYGARPLKRAVEKFALLPIARQIISMTGEQRQAVLRLLPSGRGIQVRIVQDRRSRQQKSIARGVTVVDPVSGVKAKLRPEQISQRVEELQELVASLVQQCDDEQLEITKTSLVERTTAVNFWDDPQTARETLSEVYRLERLLEAVNRVRRRTDDLTGKFASAQSRSDGKGLTAVAQRAAEVRQHAELVRFSLNCRDELDRADAILVISAVDHELTDDLPGMLADMYLAWAELKGFETSIIHEELQSPKVTQSIAILIEGVAVRGMLRDEEGLHEFVFGRTDDTPKFTRFVTVRVLPVTEDQDDVVAAGELETSAVKTRGGGLRLKRHRSTVTATHGPTHVSVTARSDRTPDASPALVLDWLCAEIRRRGIVSEELPPPGTVGVEQSIRRYTMRPQQTARDNRTGVTTTNLQALWKGELDEFLQAAVARRLNTED